MDLFLYHGQSSTCSSKVRIALHEKRLPWEGRVLDLHKGDQFDPAYLALNPNAVVPTLMVDNAPVIESGIILQLLDDIGTGPNLVPADPVAAARVRLWLKRVDDALHPAVSILTYALNMRRGWLGRPVRELIAALDQLPDPVTRAQRREVLLDGLASAPSRRSLDVARKFIAQVTDALAASHWLVGPDLTLADLACVSYFHRLELLGFAGLWDSNAAVTRWYADLLARESVQHGLLAWMREADLQRYAELRQEGEAARHLGSSL